ncbi:hypothetical protein E4A48_09555 [Xanthomonas cerealis pv. cerealis]|uniref:Uncharacterized protein n=1 Tax=Xanthomonas cerealis pv. cerealis TaxID=152263 RepID=A0A514ECX4_9XANT|nr:hypothetical protein [Xanthomonas translucens]QDI03900.1 hypothetical protein E4A48_09555 [Xanthomonas translucens pv. cerealis]UKE68223.1 hypothetical protein K8O61_11960 [Xanthomonas translucens pv. pistacia]
MPGRKNESIKSCASCLTTRLRICAADALKKVIGPGDAEDQRDALAVRDGDIPYSHQSGHPHVPTASSVYGGFHGFVSHYLWLDAAGHPDLTPATIGNRHRPSSLASIWASKTLAFGRCPWRLLE